MQNENKFGELSDSIKCNNIHIIGAQKQKRGKRGRKFIWGNNSWKLPWSGEGNVYPDPEGTRKSTKEDLH